MDVLSLPSYREGLSQVLLEAQAASVPVVSTDATGGIDAIRDGITGLLVPVGNVDALTAALDRLLSDPELRAKMGLAGCLWVQQNFRRETVWKNLEANYRSILESDNSSLEHATTSGFVDAGFVKGSHPFQPKGEHPRSGLL
jgi:glycosyltransferase involved in cell wall biosynthesis